MSDNTAQRHELRKQLLSNGFEPLPLEGKACYIKGWSTTDINDAFLEKHRRHGGYSNTGIRCGRVVAIDIDVDHKELAEECEGIIERRLGQTHFCRFGKGERRIMLYRLAEPTHKRRTARYPLGDDVAQVEILSAGQQFCAFGVHPGTGEYYYWDNDSPQTHTFDDLPLIDDTNQLYQVISDINGFLQRELGDHIPSQQLDSSDGQHVLTDDMAFDVPELGGLTTVVDIETALAEGESFKCNLTAIREGSDSLGGVAQLDHDGRLCVVDFVAGCTYFRTEEDVAAPLGEALKAIDPKHSMFNDPETRLARMLDQYVYVASDNTVRSVDDPTRGTKRDNFAVLYTDRYNAAMTLSKAWINDGGCKKVVYAALRPDMTERLYEDEQGQAVMNTYNPPVHERRVEDLTVFGAFMTHLVPDEEERELVLDWIATKVQKPWLRLHGLVMVAGGVFGTGRGTLADLLSMLLGEQYCIEVPLGHLVGATSQSQYNDYLSQSLLVSIPEALDVSDMQKSKWATRKASYENLKTVVDTGSRRTLIRRKGVANTPEQVFASIFVATNHTGALAIEPGDRRLIVVDNGVVPLAMVDDGELMQSLREAMECPEWVAALYWALEARECVYDPVGDPPMTDAKRAMVESSENGVDVAWREWVREAKGDVCTEAQWRAFANRMRNDTDLDWPDAAVMDKALRAVIKTHGKRINGDDANKQMRVEGVRVRPWIVRNWSDWKGKWEPERLRKEMLKNGAIGGDILEFPQ